MFAAAPGGITEASATRARRNGVVSVRVLLLVSGFNGVSQRVFCALNRAGHSTVVHVAERADDIRPAVESAAPDLILCPFLKIKVPRDVWARWPTIIIHPGPVGDRGPSSLDWAISDAEPRWGVTALQAVNEFDAGPIWASRTFDMPDPPFRKSALYNSRVSDAVMECVNDVIAAARDIEFVPTPLVRAARSVPSATFRPAMTQADRRISWDEPSAHIVRRIHTADGSPGVRAMLAGVPVYAYDAHIGVLDEHDDPAAEPGDVLCLHGGAVRVRTGDGTVWLGNLRAGAESSGSAPTVKLPAAMVLANRVEPGWRCRSQHAQPYREIRYRRDGDVGWLTFEFYNGAMSTQQCRRLARALRHAKAQDTTALVVRGSDEAFSNGIHLNVVEAAADPAREAWANITAMNEVCKQMISPRHQRIITAFSGSAGAGGVMLGLGADIVVARDGVILNPYYDIGLSGSELHTYTLPHRVGAAAARRLLEQRQPVDAEQAMTVGLVDTIGPRDPVRFTSWLAALAHTAATQPQPGGYTGRLPIDAIEARELAEMSLDMFDDRLGFSAARHAFVHKTPRLRAVAAA
jgi:putative two-component system hydrogenase maturation factor HypX/HoxX